MSNYPTGVSDSDIDRHFGEDTCSECGRVFEPEHENDTMCYRCGMAIEDAIDAAREEL